LIFAAALAGLVVTLYRNDVLHSAARSAGLESAYLKLESALGGPGFGTPRALEELRPAAAAAAMSPSLTAPSTTTSSSSSGAPTSSGSDTSSSESTASTASAEKAETKAVSLDSLPVEGGNAGAKSDSALQGKGTPSTPSRPAAQAKAEEPASKGPLTLDEAIRKASGVGSKSAPANAKSSQTSSSKSAPRKKGGASDFDPLNGKL
jgi:hypothetical protein